MKKKYSIYVLATLLAFITLVVQLFIPQPIETQLGLKSVETEYPTTLLIQDVSRYDYPSFPRSYIFSSPWENPTDVIWLGLVLNFIFFFTIIFMIVNLIFNKRISLRSAVLLIFVTLIGLAGLRFYETELRHDGHMHFPLNPQGTFIRQPHIVLIGDGQRVQWTIPESCTTNSYEVVTADYVEDKQPTQWSGSDEVRCTKDTDSTRTCTASLTPELEAIIQNGLPVWFVAKARECGDLGEYYISEHLIISEIINLNDFETLLDDYRQPLEEFNLLTDNNRIIWVQGTLARHLMSLTAINRDTGEIKYYDVKELGITIPEFDINPVNNLLLYSTFMTPQTFEPGEKRDAQNTTLFVYNLDTGAKLFLASMGRRVPYAPLWVGSNIVEYTTVKTGNRISFPLPDMDYIY